MQLVWGISPREMENARGMPMDRKQSILIFISIRLKGGKGESELSDEK